jgi:hypothetical protein
MSHKISILAAVVLLLGAGGLRALWSDARPSSAVKDAAARLDRLPSVIGPWQGRDQELEADAIVQGRLAGYLWRNYQNPTTHESVSVLMVCGRPGPISVHTPEACYTGAGWEMMGAPGRAAFRFPPSAPADEFRTVRFNKANAPVPERLRIYWGWAVPDQGAWQWEAPGNPRWTFVRAPALYKLYVVAEMSAAGNAAEKDPCQGFMQELLPELRKALTP